MITSNEIESRHRVDLDQTVQRWLKQERTWDQSTRRRAKPDWLRIWCFADRAVTATMLSWRLASAFAEDVGGQQR